MKQANIRYNNVAILAKSRNASTLDLRKKLKQHVENAKVFKIMKNTLEPSFLAWVEYGKYIDKIT